MPALRTLQRRVGQLELRHPVPAQPQIQVLALATLSTEDLVILEQAVRSGRDVSQWTEEQRQAAQRYEEALAQFKEQGLPA